MLRRCGGSDFEAVYSLINEAAKVYQGVIPADCWKSPYMPREELACEIEAGVEFWAFVEEGRIVGVMGLQLVQEVSLIRHAYVSTGHQRRGIGNTLVEALVAKTTGKVLVGTWRAADWAIRFWQQAGFHLVGEAEKDALLQRYWEISGRQIQTSVVLERA